jgi:hypothetical protein
MMPMVNAVQGRPQSGEKARLGSLQAVGEKHAVGVPFSDHGRFVTGISGLL